MNDPASSQTNINFGDNNNLQQAVITLEIDRPSRPLGQVEPARAAPGSGRQFQDVLHSAPKPRLLHAKHLGPVVPVWPKGIAGISHIANAGRAMRAVQDARSVAGARYPGIEHRLWVGLAGGDILRDRKHVSGGAGSNAGRGSIGASMPKIVIAGHILTMALGGGGQLQIMI